MLAMGNGVDKKCDAVAPALDRCVHFFEAADLQSAVEMLNFGLALGGFTPAVRDGRGKVTEKAILKPPARERPAFVAALVEAAEQCMEVLVTRLKFKLPEVPQQSAPEYRTSDKRAREDNDENEEEEQADDAVFEEVEEIATVPPVNKKGKGSAGVSPDDLAWDEELKRRMDAFLMQKVPGYVPATGKGDASYLALREMPCAKLRKHIVADPISGEMKSVAVPRLPKDQFLAQNMKMVERFEDETEREHFLNYISWIAQAAWGLPGADAVVRGVATGFAWQQAEPTEFFRVENYVPPEHEEKVALKLQEEEDAGRMVRTDAWSVPGISALGIVLRVVDGKVKERIVHDLSRPVGLSVNDNCVIDKRRFQSVETAFGLMQPYSYMAKIDLKSAYRFVWIAAPLFRFLASEFKDVLRIDTGFPFGAKAAPGLFSDITQLVRLMMQQRGFPGIVVYLDDFILVADTEEACQQDVLRSGYDFIGRAGRMRRFYDKVPGDLSRDLLWLAKMLEVYNGQAVVLNRRPVVRDFFAVDAAGEEAVDGGMGGFFAG
eukprot:gene5764-biopygen5785